MTPGVSTTVFPALWQITGRETLSLFEAPDGSPRERGFWNDYRALPVEVRDRADKQFALLEANPQHPSLQFKKIGERRGEEIWSARVTLKYRALAVRLDEEYLWFWIGEHNVYDTIIS